MFDSFCTEIYQKMYQVVNLPAKLTNWRNTPNHISIGETSSEDEQAKCTYTV